MLRKIIVFSAIASASTASALPSILAFEAAQAAVDSCARQGFHVTATVVDDHGLNVALLRGDGATPHTLDSSRGKAYTVVTLVPLSTFGRRLKLPQEFWQARKLRNWPTCQDFYFYRVP